MAERRNWAAAGDPAEICEIGDLEAAKLEAILAAGATPGQLEQAMTWGPASTVIGGTRSRGRPGRRRLRDPRERAPPLEDRD